MCKTKTTLRKSELGVEREIYALQSAVAVTACPQGFGLSFGTAEASCAKCEPGSYNRELELHLSPCHSCPKHAICKGGAEIVVDDGFALIRANRNGTLLDTFPCAPGVCQNSTCVPGVIWFEHSLSFAIPLI